MVGNGRTAAVDRRRMTVEELTVWRSLVDTTAELRRLLSVQLAEESGLSPADYQVLLALSEAEGKRSRSSRLAAEMEWERSRLSHHLGRMEKRGLIRREDCATDNRGAEVVLTDEGAAAFRRATAPHTKAIKKYFADALTPDQFDALADVMQTLQKHVAAR
ncbi:MarR family winged helix-turn-helix transcriptional regulator [Kribbella sp. VKM Ac-2568]|uniref:MarR family winged helix-turn-helix transcriptional regulator n=1 Tax=Kribbella sp. VKM Ac-2568 TaxID=2512219 RepID=UPI00104C38CF|nr:MarR family transcriptional regulator [Kribbella sp. VKM Ac-2568]TCM45338.1 DNA-binding MarR family transcriptional regulator [Kribbella sp. VKM Ac-2568]